MKKKSAHPKSTKSSLTTVVHLEFDHPTAKAIAVVGTFNDWSLEATPMTSLGEGHWHKDVSLEPGVYEYCLVVDGEWLPDPRASEMVPNPYGGMNSVLVVAASITPSAIKPASNLKATMLFPLANN